MAGARLHACGTSAPPQDAKNEKKALHLPAGNQRVLQPLHPEHSAVERGRAEALEGPRGLSCERDAMWSDVGSKAPPRWGWHAMDPHTGKVVA